MKPGNLQECVVPNPAATTDEDSIERTSNARCAVFVFVGFSNALPSDGGSFAASSPYESFEIHKVFLQLPWCDLRQNSSPTVRQFICASLQVITDFLRKKGL